MSTTDQADLEKAQEIYAIFWETLGKYGMDAAKTRTIAAIQIAIRDARRTNHHATVPNDFVSYGHISGRIS